MIILKSVEVAGEAIAGKFNGSLTFGDGAQVFVGPNSYGKSLVCSSIAWCLGVEMMYGVEIGDTSIFPEAARHRIDLEGAPDSPVTSSAATLVIDFPGQKNVAITRDICGGDPKFVTVKLSDQTGRPVERKLKIGWGTFGDETGGFQRVFFELAGIVPPSLMTKQGKKSQLYLENLTPLFIIEQTEGWSDIQTLQVHRYGLIEVEQAAFEFLLGLHGRLQRRVRRQSFEVHEEELRADAAAVAGDLNLLLKSRGWGEPYPSRNSFERWFTLYSTLDLRAFLFEKHSWSFEKEHEILQKQLQGLRVVLATPPPGPPSGTASLQESTAVLNLKDSLHRKREELRTLRSQLMEQQRTLHAIDAKRDSAKDLLRLKKSNIGLPEKAECPTCHNVVDPTEFTLVHQSNVEVEQYVAVLDAERHAVRSAVDSIESSLGKAAFECSRLEQNFDVAQRKLALVNSALGPQREELVATANRVIELERSIVGEKQFADRVARAQIEIDGWVKRARALAEEPSPEATRDETTRLEKFQQLFRENLLRLGHSALATLKPELVTIDDDYVPRAEHRRFRSMGSASDRARLILAYTLALQQCAVAAGAPHPGVLLLDEPLQQNPDADHRAKFIEFLASSWKNLAGQAIVFTYLKPEEAAELEKAGVRVRSFPGAKFLRSTKPPAAALPPVAPSTPVKP